MSAFIVSRVDIHDLNAMTEYMAAAPATVEKHGGIYIVRSSNVRALEGNTVCQRVVVLKFPDQEQAVTWYNSDAYRPLRDLRQRSATASILLVQ